MMRNRLLIFRILRVESAGISTFADRQVAETSQGQSLRLS
ncbi:hypothetical protein ABID49_002339 [Bhargavaea ullalensis]|uniref:Uncharacterized protein n=1 Tax=Bhargavaea ullalensis TaxID=1265685 RepID=A0ABV2GDP1_9BACL